jgi:hypothetical protein
VLAFAAEGAVEDLVAVPRTALTVFAHALLPVPDSSVMQM